MIQLAWLTAFFVLCVNAAVPAGVIEALVLFDPKLNDLTARENLSSSVANFIENLESKFTVTLQSYDDKDISLYFEDSPRYDHVVLLPSSKKAIEAKEALTQHKLLQYINEAGNVLVVGGPSSVLPDGFRGFLNELGIYPSPKGFRLYDHFHADGDKVALSTDNVIAGNHVLESLSNDKYDGGAALISNNEFIVPILKGSKTSFTAGEKDTIEDDTTWTFGEQGFLAVGLQALNNARLTWIGSESLLEEKDLVNWAFQEKGVLKLQFVEHISTEHPTNPNPTLYRVKEETIYTVGVSEYVDGKWVPYQVQREEDQLQLAFKMLDPYQRLNLKSLGPVASVEDSEEFDTNVYFANFTVPDHHGVFTFELDYKRSGLSYLLDKRVVTVRHLANDEYKRSWDITNAWVYVASAGLVVIAWFFFVVNYIYVSKTNVAKKNI